MLCKQCQQEKPRILGGQYRNGKRFWTDANGKNWRGRVCPECGPTIGRRLYGWATPDCNSDPRKQLGRKNERVAAEYLLSQGFENVTLSDRNIGPDLTATLEGKTVTIEVKTALRKKNLVTWAVNPVSPPRRNDDYVAIVFPNGSVHFCTMANHLSAAGRSGARIINSLAYAHCPELAPASSHNSQGPKLAVRRLIEAGVITPEEVGFERLPDGQYRRRSA